VAVIAGLSVIVIDPVIVDVAVHVNAPVSVIETAPGRRAKGVRRKA
jgi:hypothetical protein